MIRLYDTMLRQKRDFVPIDQARLTMYVCGPTVYGRAHIGNARPAVVFDTLRRLLEHSFPDSAVVYARNVTDVDDKIIAAAASEGVDTSVITERFERFYLSDMGALGVAPPTLAPHATADIAPMVAMIGELVAKGHAYAAEGHVLFSVASDPDYGKFSRRDREAMIAGARVEVAPYKRDAADFVLWKPSSDDVIGWDSPWGRGRPGWHIECSAMIREHLGRTIDIHGGGLDLIFPHHENEIAQSRCAHDGAPLANYWVHNGFVDMGAEKMSKSLGNVVTVDRLLSDGHDGNTLRFALLSAHYRKPLAWTNELLVQSKRSLEKFYHTFAMTFGSLEVETKFTIKSKPPSTQMVRALSDDLNTAEAIAWLHRSDDEINVLLSNGQTDEARIRAAQMYSDGELLGLVISLMCSDTHLQSLEEFDPNELNRIERRIAERTDAKARRDFGEADRIRSELAAEGILLEDGAGGTTWRRA